MRSIASALALVVLLAAPARAEDRGIDDWPQGPGREDTANLCAACHSGRIVSQQALSRARWDDMLDVMTARHKMPKLEGQEREVILAYLVRAFPERDSGYTNPFLKR